MYICMDTRISVQSEATRSFPYYHNTSSHPAKYITQVSRKKNVYFVQGRVRSLNRSVNPSTSSTPSVRAESSSVVIKEIKAHPVSVLILHP